jgi:hypothetical protein
LLLEASKLLIIRIKTVPKWYTIKIMLFEIFVKQRDQGSPFPSRDIFNLNPELETLNPIEHLLFPLAISMIYAFEIKNER